MWILKQLAHTATTVSIILRFWKKFKVQLINQIQNGILFFALRKALKFVLVCDKGGKLKLWSFLASALDGGVAHYYSGKQKPEYNHVTQIAYTDKHVFIYQLLGIIFY